MYDVPVLHGGEYGFIGDMYNTKNHNQLNQYKHRA